MSALWQETLDEIRQQKPCRLAPLVRLVILPQWWPFKIGAWAHYIFIWIAPGIREAGDEARKYIVGHEYGHIYRGHTMYPLGFLGCAILSGLGYVLNNIYLDIIGFLMTLLLFITLLLNDKKLEHEADDVAVAFAGRETVLTGAIWMAEKTNTLQKSWRKRRLERMGWTGLLKP